ncbi:hypothetical protein S83_019344, partial [Arachis hypogaea]
KFRTKSSYYSYKGNILENITGLDLSCNGLTSIIPSQLENACRIQVLNLSHNYLSGHIPSLDLSFNNLSGQISYELTKLNFLKIFNVSYNNLSKMTLSAGQFVNFDEENYRENLSLCGPLLKHKCEYFAPPYPSLFHRILHNNSVVNFNSVVNQCLFAHNL